ncbi:MAG: transposase [Deltaproteobacteria bacterium]|nr:transposase [Deltaproteobacteria bacterium]
MPQLPNRKSNRLSNYDYSNAGAYFITICSKDRKNIFSKINNAPAVLNSIKTKLTDLGNIIDKQWRDISNQYDNVDIDEFIIMPNHIHGIIIINKRTVGTGASPVPTALSKIIDAFKSKCSMEYLKYIKENKLNASGQIWQRSFYDHVIRNAKSFHKIREYIMNNPLNWDKDKNNINENRY